MQWTASKLPLQATGNLKLCVLDCNIPFLASSPESAAVNGIDELYISLNWSKSMSDLFSWGQGVSGMGLPKKLHKLSQPSPTWEDEDENRGCQKKSSYLYHLPCAVCT